MNVEKQILYNTEQMQEQYRRTKTLVACFDAGNRHGGLHFFSRGNGSVILSVEFASIEGVVSLCLDGDLMIKGEKPYYHFEMKLEKGEHFFEFDANVTHGGVRVSAEGVGIEESHRFIDRVGGYSDQSGMTVYLKNGDGIVTKCSYEDSVLSKQDLIYRFYDEAYLFDKTNGIYGTTRRYIYSENGVKLYLIIGRTQTVTLQELKAAAICDGRTLETGADYLAAYVDQNGKLGFFRVVDGARFNSSNYSSEFLGYERILSAQRGSIFLVENKEHFWSGLFFHAEGEKSLAFTQHTFHYDEIPLCRNKYCSPTATIDESDGTPIFYFKREDGKLMRMAYGAEATVVGYEEAFHPGVTGGLYQSDGELRDYSV